MSVGEVIEALARCGDQTRELRVALTDEDGNEVANRAVGRVYRDNFGGECWTIETLGPEDEKRGI